MQEVIFFLELVSETQIWDEQETDAYHTEPPCEKNGTCFLNSFILQVFFNALFFSAKHVRRFCVDSKLQKLIW